RPGAAGTPIVGARARPRTQVRNLAALLPRRRRGTPHLPHGLRQGRWRRQQPRLPALLPHPRRPPDARATDGTERARGRRGSIDDVLPRDLRAESDPDAPRGPGDRPGLRQAGPPLAGAPEDRPPPYRTPPRRGVFPVESPGASRRRGPGLPFRV